MPHLAPKGGEGGYGPGGYLALPSGSSGWWAGGSTLRAEANPMAPSLLLSQATWTENSPPTLCFAVKR